MNSDDLKKLNTWKLRLQKKKDDKPLDPPYEGGRAYADMSPEIKLIFDALSDVIEALTKG
jgi:hypothetical protein